MSSKIFFFSCTGYTLVGKQPFLLLAICVVMLLYVACRGYANFMYKLYDKGAFVTIFFISVGIFSTASESFALIILPII